MTDARTRLGRALRESEETTAVDNRVAHLSFGKTQKSERIEAAKDAADTAQTTADQAAGRAEEAIADAASRLGYIDFQELIQNDKLSGELPGVYISNVAAESILAGDIDAEYLNVRGRINVGPVMLDPEGITLPTTGELEDPDQNVARKIKTADGSTALDFPVGSVSKGVRLTGTGNEGGLEGVVRLLAKTRPTANSAGPSSASVVVRSTLGGRGLMWAANSTDLRVDGVTDVRGGLSMTGAYAWQTVSPVNGWSNSPGNPGQYRLTPWGTVQLRGQVDAGDPNVALFFLPTNATPTNNQGHVIRSGTGWASSQIEFGGSSTPGAFRLAGWSGATVNSVKLDGVEFSL